MIVVVVHGPAAFHADEFERAQHFRWFDKGDGEGLVILPGVGGDDEELDGIAGAKSGGSGV